MGNSIPRNHLYGANLLGKKKYIYIFQSKRNQNDFLHSIEPFNPALRISLLHTDRQARVLLKVGLLFTTASGIHSVLISFILLVSLVTFVLMP